MFDIDFCLEINKCAPDSDSRHFLGFGFRLGLQFFSRCVPVLNTIIDLSAYPHFTKPASGNQLNLSQSCYLIVV